METWNVVLLGLIQGLTEFLPVSSSGHLALAPSILNVQDQGLAMDAILHLGTLLAILLFFRKDLLRLLWSLLPGSQDTPFRKLALAVIAASFPAGLIGLAFGDWIGAHLRSPVFIASNLIFWSGIFWWAESQRRTSSASHKVENLTFGQVFFIGCAQAMALLPGTSRSGVTLAAGLYCNLSSTTAARFSFLLGAPIIAAAGLLKTAEFLFAKDQEFAYTGAQLGIGFVVSFLTGLAAIRILMEILSRKGLLPFIIYRVLLACGVLIMSFSQ